MSLASIAVVVCALLAPGPRDLGSVPQAQAQEQSPRPQEQKPVQPQETPPAQPPATTPPPAPSGAAAPARNKSQAPPKKSAAKLQTKRKTAAKKKTATVKKVDPTAEEAPPKRVVRNGGTPEPVNQISPSMPEPQASSQLMKTTDLLNSADTNLKSISGATLNSSQEDMVKQVRTFMEQAKAAVEAGDLERANNLATKAQLLSAELVKH